jgi:hypothetical protein
LIFTICSDFNIALEDGDIHNPKPITLCRRMLGEFGITGEDAEFKGFQDLSGFTQDRDNIAGGIIDRLRLFT